MQTVLMSFARGLYLGKPELPIDHVHVYFPVQIVHKVIAQCEALKLKEEERAANGVTVPPYGRRRKQNRAPSTAG